MTRQHVWYIILAVMFCFAISGCAIPPQTVSVPVPVKCKEPMPDRPSLPTDNVPASASLDTKVRAALAEIELREGYEDRLRTALGACR
jgi:type IV pilus biogenesis protein CpaD/CtpE